MKHLHIITAIMVVSLLATGCKKESFTIEGTLTDGGTQNLRVMYVTDYETLYSEWITMTDGHFKFTGNNYDWTMVYLVNNKKEIIARTALKNGDNISITGSMAEPFKMQVTGNDATEEWNTFITQNADLYTSHDLTRLNHAIEEYIKANPDHVSSTLLLLNDYANLPGTTPIDSLFQNISIEARPSGLVNNYFSLTQQLDDEKINGNVPPIMLYNSEDTITTITMARYRATVLYFWNKKDTQRNIVIADLKEMYNKHDEKNRRLQIVDIMMSPDSTGWKRTLAKDSTQWSHYWAPGGTLERNLVNLGIETTPCFIVTTSVGKQLYRGSSVDEAIAATEKQMQQ